MTTFPTVGAITAVSQGPGTNPRWAAASDALLFTRRDQIFAVRVGPGRGVGAPRLVASGGVSGITDFDVFPDGSLLVIRSEETEPAVAPLVVVTGWASRPATSGK